MERLDTFLIKMCVILAYPLNMGSFCLHFPFNCGHIFYLNPTVCIDDNKFWGVTPKCLFSRDVISGPHAVTMHHSYHHGFVVGSL